MAIDTSMLPYGKPQRGADVLEREIRRLRLQVAERENKVRAKQRDGWRCRWPEKHQCRLGLEGVHIFEDKGMGGDHGQVSGTWNLMTICAWLHGRGPESIHGKELKVTPKTAAGADGPCDFWRRDATGEYHIVSSESAIGIVDKD